MGLTQVNTSSHLGHSYHVGRNTIMGVSGQKILERDKLKNRLKLENAQLSRALRLNFPNLSHSLKFESL